MSSENPNPITPRPARRFGAGTVVGVAVLSAVLAGGGAAMLAGHGNGAQDAGASAPQPAKTQYQCPMHPSIVQDQPGDCPICGMKLVPVQPGAGAGTGSAERKIKFYRSPMNPSVTSPTPKKDEMGMDYLPVYEDEANGSGDGMPGLAAVTIDPARQQLIGLKTVPVVHGQIGGAWRTTGRIAVDETRVRHINIKVPGFVERIYVDFIGKPVRKGEPLFSIYSPELFSAQEEYLLALRTRSELAKSSGASSADGDMLVKAARRKLQLWDVPDSELERLAASGEPQKTLTLTSPVSGVVTKKDVVEGMKLDAGAMPYEIVDLSQVWVLADVYESELRFVKVGMPATLTLNAFPNHPFTGKVAFIDPMLDPQTRTVKVRLEFPNPTGELRPEMFGEVVLQGSAHEGLSIPVDAVIDSGTKKIVFVAVGEGKFQPREVRLGDSDGTNVEVVSGLDDGEHVVTRANFLVDSESRLRASLSEMAAGQGGGAPSRPEDSARVLPGATGGTGTGVGTGTGTGTAPGAAAPGAGTGAAPGAGSGAGSRSGSRSQAGAGPGSGSGAEAGHGGHGQ